MNTQPWIIASTTHRGRNTINKVITDEEGNVTHTVLVDGEVEIEGSVGDFPPMMAVMMAGALVIPPEGLEVDFGGFSIAEVVDNLHCYSGPEPRLDDPDQELAALLPSGFRETGWKVDLGSHLKVRIITDGYDWIRLVWAIQPWGAEQLFPYGLWLSHSIQHTQPDGSVTHTNSQVGSVAKGLLLETTQGIPTPDMTFTEVSTGDGSVVQGLAEILIKRGWELPFVRHAVGFPGLDEELQSALLKIEDGELIGAVEDGAEELLDVLLEERPELKYLVRALQNVNSHGGQKLYKELAEVIAQGGDWFDIDEVLAARVPAHQKQDA